jgi:hypothetical protein
VKLAVKKEYLLRSTELSLVAELEAVAAADIPADTLGHLTGDGVGVATATRDGVGVAEARAEALSEADAPDDAVGLAAEPARTDEAIELTPVTRTTTRARPMPGSNPGTMPALAVDGRPPMRMNEATVRRP